MFSQRNSNNTIADGLRLHMMSLLLATLVVGIVATPLHAQDDPPPVTLGAGLQTSILHHQPSGDDTPATTSFRLNSLRFYVNGSATENIKFMVNTDISYGGSLGAPGSQKTDFQILDAVARIELSDSFNLWVGRHLPPSDRANLYGPYYSSHWGVFTDGVQDGYPFVFQGRNNGVTYWGQFGKVKVSLGAFDGASATGDNSILTAGRVQVNFWDPEAGYYLNGTYYGDKDLLTFGFATQVQSGGETKQLGNGITFKEVSTKNASSVDFLLEQGVAGGGAVTLEAEWARYDGLGGYPTAPGAAFQTLKGGYVLAAYLFPEMSGIGIGRFQVLGKYAHANYSNDRSSIYPDFHQKTTEVNLNYIINQHNARVMLFLKNTDYSAVRADDFQVGLALQIQM